jgi:hypothetical protein
MQKASSALPDATDFLMTLPPFDFGPRPEELKGKTTMMAIENNDDDGHYLYFGEISTYDGHSMCGKGIRVWSEGDTPAILVGWFRNGQFTGKGRNIFENSLVYYEGDFFNYEHHGNGVITYPDGDVYTGTFKNNKRDGNGVCRYGNGRVYTGEWKAGAPHGKGKMEFTLEGYTREGDWKNGRMEGNQVVTYKTGKVKHETYENFKLVKEIEVKPPK